MTYQKQITEMALFRKKIKGTIQGKMAGISILQKSSYNMDMKGQQNDQENEYARACSRCY